MTNIHSSGKIKTVPLGTGRCYIDMVGGWPPLQGVTLLAPCPLGRGVVNVNTVTYEELFQLILVFISFASLIYQIVKKK